MKVGFIHDEYGYSWKMRRGYSYRSQKAYFARTRGIHGSVHHLTLALKGYKLPFRPDFDYSPYDLLIFYLQGGRCERDVRYMKLIKEKYPNILLMLWWGEIYRLDQKPEAMFEHILKAEFKLMQYIDLLVGPLRYETLMMPILKKLKKQFRWIPPPYDTKHLKKYHSKTILNPDNGIWTMVHGRANDISRSLTVMGKLQDDFNIRCLVHPYGYLIEEKIKKLRDKVASNLKIEIDKSCPSHNEYLDRLKDWYFIFDDYPAYSASRLTIETACIGTPTLCNEYNAAGSICFPRLTFSLNDLDGWYEAAARLINDETFYKEVMRFAQKRAEEYFSYDAVKKCIEKIYEEFKK